MKRVRGSLRKIIIIIVVVLVIYLIAVLFRIPHVLEQERTEETVEFINAQKITLDDVTGANLPPTPDPNLADATIEGIDANKNGIRDDVELAIFDLYPTDLEIRSASLQYAMALQLELTHVFNSETLVATLKNTDRGSSCLFGTIPAVSLSDGEDRVKEVFAIGDSRVEKVETLVFSTEERELKREEVFKKYMTSYGSDDKEDCDVIF